MSSKDSFGNVLKYWCLVNNINLLIHDLEITVDMSETQKNDHVSLEEFQEAVQKIHQKHKETVQMAAEIGVPTLQDVVDNQKRLATMIEFIVQSINEQKK